MNMQRLTMSKPSFFFYIRKNTERITFIQPHLHFQKENHTMSKRGVVTAAPPQSSSKQIDSSVCLGRMLSGQIMRMSQTCSSNTQSPAHSNAGGIQHVQHAVFRSLCGQLDQFKLKCLFSPHMCETDYRKMQLNVTHKPLHPPARSIANHSNALPLSRYLSLVAQRQMFLYCQMDSEQLISS